MTRKQKNEMAEKEAFRVYGAAKDKHCEFTKTFADKRKENALHHQKVSDAIEAGRNIIQKTKR